MIQKNDRITVTITEINSFGFGVAQAQGIAIFVAQGAPGDVACVHIVKTARTYAIAKIEQLITPSPCRITPDCAVSASCGGCAYSHISDQSESQSKCASVAAQLRKAGLSAITVHPLRSPSPATAYRNKTQMPFAPDGSLGYYASKSHRVVCPQNGCRLLPPIFNEIADAVTAFVRQNGISIYNESTGSGLARHLYLRRGTVTGEIMVCLVINGKYLPCAQDFCTELTDRFTQIKTIVLNHNMQKTNVILGRDYTVLTGNGTITDELCGNKYEISPPSFYQINHATAEAIYQKAIELAELGSDDTLADLYCGIGTIALSAAHLTAVREVIGVEIIPEAIENARKNARLNGIENARFYCGDANDPHIADCSVMIVDPPRKGLSAELIPRIAQISPKRLVYVSCAPNTLARDLRAFAEHGYHTDEIFTYNMFPRTAHTECVCVLRPPDGK